MFLENPCPNFKVECKRSFLRFWHENLLFLGFFLRKSKFSCTFWLNVEKRLVFSTCQPAFLTAVCRCRNRQMMWRIRCRRQGACRGLGRIHRSSAGWCLVLRNASPHGVCGRDRHSRSSNARGSSACSYRRWWWRYEHASWPPVHWWRNRRPRHLWLRVGENIAKFNGTLPDSSRLN